MLCPMYFPAAKQAGKTSLFQPMRVAKQSSPLVRCGWIFAVVQQKQSHESVSSHAWFERKENGQTIGDIEIRAPHTFTASTALSKLLWVCWQWKCAQRQFIRWITPHNNGPLECSEWIRTNCKRTHWVAHLGGWWSPSCFSLVFLGSLDKVNSETILF